MMRKLIVYVFGGILTLIGCVLIALLGSSAANAATGESKVSTVALTATPVSQIVPVPAYAPPPNAGPAIAAAALAQVGRNQDCTVAASNALAAVGVHFRGWPRDYYSLGYPVTAAQAQPGDLIYYANGGMGLAHIAVYIGNGMAVHGGWYGNQTTVFSAYIGSGPNFIRVTSSYPVYQAPAPVRPVVQAPVVRPAAPVAPAAAARSRAAVPQPAPVRPQATAIKVVPPAPVVKKPVTIHQTTTPAPTAAVKAPAVPKPLVIAPAPVAAAKAPVTTAAPKAPVVAAAKPSAVTIRSTAVAPACETDYFHWKRHACSSYVHNSVHYYAMCRSDGKTRIGDTVLQRDPCQSEHASKQASSIKSNLPTTDWIRDAESTSPPVEAMFGDRRSYSCANTSVLCRSGG